LKPADWIVLIMAGGAGTRFWPRSRRRLPKQLLPITGPHSMIRQTFLRLKGLVKPEQVWVIAGSEHVALIRRQIPELDPSHVIPEPCGRNTAACVAVMACMQSGNPDSVMLVLPADHFIRDRKQFHASLRAGAAAARKHHALVTFGIVPEFPATGYGYLELAEQQKKIGSIAYARVRRFVEKPDARKARRYVSSRRFLWNSGMFAWEVGTILESLRRHLPEACARLEGVPWSQPRRASRELSRLYPGLPNTSIDYAIMEKSDNIYAVRATFDWSDVGSWETVGSFLARDGFGNASRGKLVAVDSKGMIVDAGDKLVAAVGVSDLIVVDSGDALLVCHRSRAEDVKQVVERLRAEHLLQFI
jgi:mannose-1-phosphate guanylyltransferase